MRAISNSGLRLLRRSGMRGVGLVEVLIALVVISLGVVGLAQFQGVVFKEGGSAKARSIAVQLARAKLDDLRSYTQLPAGTAGVFGYDELANNAGGAELGNGSLRLPAGSVTISAVAYARGWTATGYYYCATNAAPSTTNCAGAAAKTRPDFYALTVTIGWTDADGTARSVVLNDTASSVDPMSGAQTLINSPSSGGPKVSYVPGLAPQVVAIDVGGGQKKETTNPTPTLRRHGNTVKNTIATYETIRYNSDSTITRQQFVTLNCSCTQQGSGTGENREGLSVTKRIGVPSDNFQAPECKVCCRDHHDTPACDATTDAGRKNCYDPFRPSTDYFGSTGDHNHYNANQQLANAVGDTYVESCRLVRVDGFLRVDQDWRMIALNTIPESFLSGGAANITSYANYVKSAVTAFMAGSTAPAPVWSTSETVARDATKQLLTRGIYVDYLDSATRSNYVTRINANDATVFQEIPFYEVNLTKLAQWTSAQPSVATVSNDALVSESAGQNLYSRGLVRGIAAGQTGAQARARVGNTGVINEFITSDPHDGSVSLASSVTITVPGVTYVFSGAVTGVPTTVIVAVNGVGSGTNSNFSCNYDRITLTFGCTVPAGWSGQIVPSASGYSFAPSALSVSNAGANNTSISFAGTAIANASYTISGSIAPALAAASVAATGSGSSANGTCTYTAATGAYSCTVPGGWSGTVIPSAAGQTFTPGSYSAMNVSGNLTQNFTATAATSTSYTISGTVLTPPTLSTVAITAVGSASVSCTYTSANGAYSCVVPNGWTGSITPSSDTGILFSPTTYSYNNGVSSNITSQNFTTSYTIYGLISQSSGVVLSGVSLSAVGSGGSGNGTCAYDGSTGGYACVVPGLWNGSIIPTLNSFVFEPSTRSYVNVTSRFLSENYTATAGTSTPYTITVTMTGLGPNTVATVLSGTGASCNSAVYGGSGNDRTATVTCTVPGGWNGTVTPSIQVSGNQTATFTPVNRSFSNVLSNQTASFACSGNGC